MIGVDADIGRDGQRLVDDVACAELRVLQQRERSALRIGAARPDRDDALLRLEHVAHAGDDERMLAVSDGQHRLEASQDAIGTPVLGQLDGRAHEIALVLLELRFEALEEREGIGRAAGEAGEDAILVDAAHFLRAALDHDLTERHLPIAAERHGCAAANGKDGGAVELLHREMNYLDEARLPQYQAVLRGLVTKAISMPTTTIAHTIIAPDGRSVTTEITNPAA